MLENKKIKTLQLVSNLTRGVIQFCYEFFPMSTLGRWSKVSNQLLSTFSFRLKCLVCHHQVKEA